VAAAKSKWMLQKWSPSIIFYSIFYFFVGISYQQMRLALGKAGCQARLPVCC
jgi:hypothetical protein